MKTRTETSCPKCNNKFSVSNNRIYQIKRKYWPLWFIDAMNQFEHFNEVKCPKCGCGFISDEARLFLISKSPYTVVIIGLLFLVLIFVCAVRIGWLPALSGLIQTLKNKLL